MARLEGADLRRCRGRNSGSRSFKATDRPNGVPLTLTGDDLRGRDFAASC